MWLSVVELHLALGGEKDREHLVNILQAHVEQQKAQEWKTQAAQQQFDLPQLEVFVLIRP